MICSFCKQDASTGWVLGSDGSDGLDGVIACSRCTPTVALLLAERERAEYWKKEYEEMRRRRDAWRSKFDTLKGDKT